MTEQPTTLERDSPAWILQVWASFVLSVGTTSLGIVFLPVDNWIRGFLAMGLLFTVGSCLSLAKTVRDQYEARKLIHKISEAKTEKLLREYDAA